MAGAGKLSGVAAAKAKGPAVLHDGGGLYLRVSATGSKAWVFRFQLAGRRHDMGSDPTRRFRWPRRGEGQQSTGGGGAMG
jgi:hypothetical protein